MNPDTGGCNGEGYLLLSGGVAPYTVTWNDAANQTGQSAFNLCSGNYEATVVDANGCVTIVPLSIQYVGLEELFAEKISVYPNPFDNEIIINSEIEDQSFSVILRDLLGRMVIAPTTLLSGQVNVKTDQLKKGVYSLFLLDANYNVIRTEKVVKH